MHGVHQCRSLGKETHLNWCTGHHLAKASREDMSAYNHLQNTGFASTLPSKIGAIERNFFMKRRASIYCHRRG